MIKSPSQGSGKIRLVLGLMLIMVACGGIDQGTGLVLFSHILLALSGIGLMFWAIPSLQKGQ